MKSLFKPCRPQELQRVGGLLAAGLAITVCLLVLSAVPARAAWPWFSGYLNASNSYSIYAYTDWDSPLFGGGMDPDTDVLGIFPPAHRVDGHVVYQADGTGNCKIIEATGSCSAWLGNVYPVSIQFSTWFGNPSSPPASDTRHDWDSNFLNILSSPVVSLPTLTVVISGANCCFSWPTNTQGFTVQCSADLSPGSWSDVTNEPAVVSTNYVMTLSATNTTIFFRLKQ
jgi:hypothetical protein